MFRALKTGKGQVILEFTFCMIIVLLMIYGVTKVFFWTGRDFAERSIAHDSVLVTAIEEDYSRCLATNATGFCIEWSSIGDGPLRQIDPYFYTPITMNAIWDGN